MSKVKPKPSLKALPVTKPKPAASGTASQAFASPKKTPPPLEELPVANLGDFIVNVKPGMDGKQRAHYGREYPVAYGPPRMAKGQTEKYLRGLGLVGLYFAKTAKKD